MTGAGLAACLLLALAATPSDARAETRSDGRLWLAAIGQGSLGRLDPRLEKWRWWLEGQARFRDDFGTFDQGFPRAALGYTIFPKTAIWLGYAWIRTEPASGADSNENRIFQQLTWSRVFDPVTLAARTRLEQRILDTGSATGWRFRQWFKLTVPLWSRLSLVAHDEVFVHLNSTDWGADSGLDQNRFFIGPGWDIDRDRHFRVEVGYLNQFVDQSSGANQLNHVLALVLLLNF